MNLCRARLTPALVLLAIAGAACTTAGGTAAHPQPSGTTPPAAVTLHLGYMADLTQASALVGIQDNVFASSLGPNVTLTATVFKSGTEEGAALGAGSLDAAYVGPNTAIAAFLRAKDAVRVVSGATSGGVFLMTKYAVKSPADLRGQKVAVAAAGDTADVALRTWLKSQGLNPNAGGNVSVVTMPNASILPALQQGSIAGAWVPEPWASLLQVEGNAKVFLDEASLWPNGHFPTALLMVGTAFLQKHPDVVANLIVGQVAANDLVKRPSAQIEKDAATAIKNLTGVALSQAVSDLSWLHLSFTDDPLAAAIAADAGHALALGQIPAPDLTGMYRLAPLNDILKAANEPQVSAG